MTQRESERDWRLAGFSGPGCCAQTWMHRTKVKRLNIGGAHSELGRGMVVSKKVVEGQNGSKATVCRLWCTIKHPGTFRNRGVSFMFFKESGPVFLISLLGDFDRRSLRNGTAG